MLGHLVLRLVVWLARFTGRARFPSAHRATGSKEETPCDSVLLDVVFEGAPGSAVAVTKQRPFLWMSVTFADCGVSFTPHCGVRAIVQARHRVGVTSKTRGDVVHQLVPSTKSLQPGMAST